ncbi:MAG: PilW family protein [Candidatus Paceibacterales bacterium]
MNPVRNSKDKYCFKEIELIKCAPKISDGVKKGFTLMEILVYIGILAIIVLAASSFFLWISRSNTKAKVTRETLDNARRAMEIITYEIKEAEGIYTPTSAFSTSTGQLSLETTKYLLRGEDTTYIDFYLCQKRLCLKKEGQNPIAFTSDRVEIKNLEFSQIATTSTIPSVQINLRVDYKTPAAKPEYQASINTTSTASLRSY